MRRKLFLTGTGCNESPTTHRLISLENQGVYEQVKNCLHNQPAEMRAGRKTKLLILYCKKCGLVLDIKEVKK